MHLGQYQGAQGGHTKAAGVPCCSAADHTAARLLSDSADPFAFEAFLIDPTRGSFLFVLSLEQAGGFFCGKSSVSLERVVLALGGLPACFVCEFRAQLLSPGTQASGRRSGNCAGCSALYPRNIKAACHGTFSAATPHPDSTFAGPPFYSELQSLVLSCAVWQAQFTSTGR